MRSRLDVAVALAYRQTTVLLKNPSLFLPPMLFPLMNFLAFAGGLSRLRHVPGFQFEGGYTAFTFALIGVSMWLAARQLKVRMART